MDTESSLSKNVLDEMYLFSQTSPCRLSPIGGEVMTFDVNNLITYNDNFHKKIALSRKAPMDYLGDDYLNMYSDCTPALELLFKDYS